MLASIQRSMGARTKNAKIRRETGLEGEGAIPAEELEQPFPEIDLPIRPPFPPMEARSADEVPTGENWLYEPKWDGFRCLAFRKGSEALLQSKSGQPLGRYFPEMVDALRQLPQKQFVLDGEILIVRDGKLSFDDLLMRIHPAESRIRKLSKETPASYLVFDLLVDEKGRLLMERPLSERWSDLGKLFEAVRDHSIRRSPSTTDIEKARRWMTELSGSGFDGVVAKRLEMPYMSGERTGMVKIKNIRSADCVVGGFRYASKGGGIGSLLLGLYDEEGELNHVGFTSSFNSEMRAKLKPIVEKLKGGSGFTGSAPGGPSRWSTERSGEWEPLKPKLVCEVTYDHFSGGRFRHGTKFLRWRPDKDPKLCTYEQLQSKRGSSLRELGLTA
jgi:ATP-dependent DNA ligase